MLDVVELNLNRVFCPDFRFNFQKSSLQIFKQVESQIKLGFWNGDQHHNIQNLIWVEKLLWLSPPSGFLWPRNKKPFKAVINSIKLCESGRTPPCIVVASSCQENQVFLHQKTTKLRPTKMLREIPVTLTTETRVSQSHLNVQFQCLRKTLPFAKNVGKPTTNHETIVKAWRTTHLRFHHRR